MKHVLLLLFLIPCGLFAQDRWSDGLYSTPNIRTVNNASATNKNDGARTIATYPPDLKISRTSNTFEFPNQASLSVSPNPAISNTRAVFASQQNGLQYQLYMVSIDGKPLLRKSGTTVTGTNIINLDMSSYPMGTYYLQLTVGERRELIPFVKAVR